MDMVNWKLRAAILHGLTPIVCVGESIERHEAGLTKAVLNWQIACALNGLESNSCENLIYRLRTHMGDRFGEHSHSASSAADPRIIRTQLTDVLGPARAGAIWIIYRGSVKPENISELMALEDVDGALVDAVQP